MYGSDDSNDYVTIWVDGYPPEDYGQWEGRTSMVTPEGDVTINDLQLIDDGRYVCRYDYYATPPGSEYGEKYMLEVTGLYYHCKYIENI